MAIGDPLRLAALARTELFGTPPEECFDRFTRLAARLTGAPFALMTLGDADTLELKSVGGEYQGPRRLSLEDSFCRFILADRGELVIGEARSHPMVAELPLVLDGSIGAYAGVPILSDDEPIGALCAVDGAARSWSDEDLEALRDLAQGLMTELRLRVALREQAAARQAVDARNRDLRHQTLHDGLTGLGNRRKLHADLRTALERGEPVRRLVLCDLDGFKHYNDTFGHLAGDALLRRLALALRGALPDGAEAYRMGGDEFCVLDGDSGQDISAYVAALAAEGDGFRVTASFGAVDLAGEVSDASHALRLADQRMYESKRSSARSPVRQSSAVLQQALLECSPSLAMHLDTVADLAERTARQLGLPAEDVEQVRMAAELHDIGKVAVPAAILDKAGPLDAEERAFVEQHTIVGERILAAAPALAGVAGVVRATHERFDGGGYPDGLAGDAIPLGARVVHACDTYEAMTAARPYATPWSHHEAVAELRRLAGTQFDPAVVTALCEVLASGRGTVLRHAAA